MKTETIDGYFYHTDASHGWLEVPRSELIELGIADSISHYSYQDAYNTDNIYLEHDLDAAIFANAKTAIGEDIKTVHIEHQSVVVVENLVPYRN
tara:strand:+ start:358 stop:639 length:282 start_codon:yes stop_codon:yes gene_type:complete